MVALGVTAEELAESCGLTTDDVLGLRDGTRVPSYDEGISLALTLGVRPEDLSAEVRR